MNDPSRNPIPKWWLQSIAVLVTGSPPALILWFQDALSLHISAVSPQILVRVFAFLLLTILAVIALLIFQRPWLKWDAPTGTWVNKIGGLRYCGTCRAKKLFVPLKNEVGGWRCVACSTFRTDPLRKSNPSAVVPVVAKAVTMKHR